MSKLFDPVLTCTPVEVAFITFSKSIDNAFIPIVILDKLHKEDGFVYLKPLNNINLSPWITRNNPLPIEIVQFDGNKDYIILKFKVEKGNPKANDIDGGNIEVEAIGVTVEPTMIRGKKYTTSFELKVSLDGIKKGASIRFKANDDDFWGTDGGVKDVFCGGISIKGIKAPEGYYYMEDGTLVGRIGKYNDSTDVYRFKENSINIDDAKKLINEINTGEEKGHKLVKVSSSVGMKNEELNTRVFFTLIRQAENGNRPDREPLAYNVNYGGGIFSNYDKHPNKPVTKWGNTSDAAGAYQILVKSWRNINKVEKQKDFSPKSQDRGAIILIIEQVKWNSHKKDLISDIESGKIENACANLNTTWTSLPGGAEQHMSIEDAWIIYKENIAKELKGKSVIETPKGKLTLKL